MSAALTTTGGYVDLTPGPVAWAVLAGCVGGLIIVDLLRHRGDAEPRPRQALLETLAYVACGLVFGIGVWATWGGAAFGEYLSGFVVEKSLSVDNVFVWALLFASFSIPTRYQRRVLFWGVFGALALRGIFIAAGTAIVGRFWWTLMIMGAVLIVSGLKVLRHRDDEGEGGHDRSVALLGRFLPVTDRFDGHRFLTRIDGRRHATLLLAALVVIELTDVIFAVDSVPAVLAVSRTPYLIFASNAFAILGLRSLYFLLADAHGRFHYLSHGLGLVLLGVGAKMIVGRWVHVPTAVSLAAIAGILAVAIGASIVRNRRHAAADAAS